MPQWQKPFTDPSSSGSTRGSPDVLIFADTFSCHFEPDNLRAALSVLRRAGYDAGVADPPLGRALCCGRTYLATGLVEQAKAELRRSTQVFAEAIAAGKTIVGLEPSCVLTFRDEAPNLLPDWTEEQGAQILTFAEYVMREREAGRFDVPLGPVGNRALLHGHCHQKAFSVVDPVVQALSLIPDLTVEQIESSCCGMAGSFGYQSETYEVSKAMAELSLIPAVRAADPDAIIVADGTSCRHQISDLGGREALHIAQVLERAAAAAP